MYFIGSHYITIMQLTLYYIKNFKNLSKKRGPINNMYIKSIIYHLQVIKRRPLPLACKNWYFLEKHRMCPTFITHQSDLLPIQVACRLDEALLLPQKIFLEINRCHFQTSSIQCKLVHSYKHVILKVNTLMEDFDKSWVWICIANCKSWENETIMDFKWFYSYFLHDLNIYVRVFIYRSMCT